jgi:hypothetical protein
MGHQVVVERVEVQVVAERVAHRVVVLLGEELGIITHHIMLMKLLSLVVQVIFVSKTFHLIQGSQLVPPVVGL